ncbi:MAG: BamA/TamA family outer membrane protein [Cyclobacteriaceae bacterium]
MKKGFVVSYWWVLLLLFGIAFPAYSQTPATFSVNDIFILGNKKTKASIILREFGIDKGKLVDSTTFQSTLDSAQIRIYNTNLFNTVVLQPLYAENQLVDILIKVEERWYFYPSPFVRIADRNLMDWVVNRGSKIERFNAGLKLDQYNFRGRNERLRFIGQIGFERRFALGYILPYIEKTQRHGLGFELVYNEREKMPYITNDHLPTFLNTEDINRTSWFAETTHSFRPNYYSTHYTSLGFSQTAISDTIASLSLNPNFLGNGKTSQRFFFLKYSYVNDLRNNRNYPTSGELLRVNLEQQGIGIYDDISISSIQVVYNKYFELKKNFYYAAGLIGYFSTPRAQPYYNFAGLGYDGILARGFELDVIEGPRYFLMKNSVRKLFFTGKKDMKNFMPVAQFNDFKISLYGKLIADFGYVQNYPNYEISSRLTDTLLYSVGAGLDVVTIYDLVLRFEYTYNSQDTFNFALNIQADIN